MHSRALELLRQLGEKEADVKDRLVPSITYLQRLGPDHLDSVFQHSRWIFDENAEMAMEIFTSEQAELPPQHVANFLESVNPKLCARYLEFLIDERHEESSIYHDCLAELYLKMTIDAKKAGDEGRRMASCYYSLTPPFTAVLTACSACYRAMTSLKQGLFSSEDWGTTIVPWKYTCTGCEIMTKRSGMLYCKRIHQPDTETRNIFFTLLRIYLRPLVRTTDDLLRPALELIARHGPRLNPEETLQMLPPLVAARDVRAFLTGALRVQHFDARVVRGVALARNEQVARKLMYLEANCVKINRQSHLPTMSQADRSQRHCCTRCWWRSHPLSLPGGFLQEAERQSTGVRTVLQDGIQSL